MALYRTKSARSRLILNVVTAATMMLVGASLMRPAYAQSNTRQFSANAGAIVDDALKSGNDEDYQAALDHLLVALKTPRLNAYESATIYQMIGQYKYELGRFDEAIEAFENAIATPAGLLPAEEKNLDVVVAQLLIGNGKHREGATRLRAHLDYESELKPQYLELMVQALVQAEDYSEVLPWAEKWFDDAEPISNSGIFCPF